MKRFWYAGVMLLAAGILYGAMKVETNIGFYDETGKKIGIWDMTNSKLITKDPSKCVKFLVDELLAKENYITAANSELTMLRNEVNRLKDETKKLSSTIEVLSTKEGNKIVNEVKKSSGTKTK